MYTRLHGAQIGALTAVALVLTVSGWNSALAQTPPCEVSKFLGGDSVALSGSTMFVGASGDEWRAGKVRVWEHVDGFWQQVNELLPDQEVGGFGWSVALLGDTAVVGAPLHNFESGSAFVFERVDGSWTQVARLIASDGDASDRFGWSVAIAENLIAVGAMWDNNDNGQQAGAAYVFEKPADGWPPEMVATDKLIGEEWSDEFGSAVGIADGQIVVGARGSREAYVFEKVDGNWTDVARLTPDGPASGFGVSVSMTSVQIVIGAWGANRAYVFEKEGGSWQQTVALKPSDGRSYDQFGVSVATTGDRVIVGAEWHSHGRPRNGAAYLFEALLPKL